MRKIILAGISISLLAGMIFTACEDAQTDLKRESSVSVSSVYMNSEISSADIASVLSESASSTVTSSNKAVSSNKITSSEKIVSSNKVTSFESVSSIQQISSSSKAEKPYSEYTKEEIEKLDMLDNKVVVKIKKEYINRNFTLSDFPEVDGIDIYIYDVLLELGYLNIDITLKKHSKQGVFDAIKKLEKNQFVTEAYPAILAHTTN